MWHVTRDMWHVTCDPQGPTWALSGSVERGTNERPGIWSCDLWRRPLQCKEMSSSQGTYRQTDRHTDIATLWLNRHSGPIQWTSFQAHLLRIRSWARCWLSPSRSQTRWTPTPHWLRPWAGWQTWPSAAASAWGPAPPWGGPSHPQRWQCTRTTIH